MLEGNFDFNDIKFIAAELGLSAPRLLDDDGGSGADEFRKFGDIPVVHADATSAAATADFIWLVGAVDADASSAKAHPMYADRIVRSGGNSQASGTALSSFE